MSDVKRASAAPPAFPRPLPKLEGAAAPYWQALRDGRIELPRCNGCDCFVFPPRPFCPHCHGREVNWQAVAPRGRVYTFTVVHKPTNPFFLAAAPYTYALVELDCGVRLPTRIVGGDAPRLRIGDRVEAVFEKASEAVTLLCFRRLGTD